MANNYKTPGKLTMRSILFNHAIETLRKEGWTVEKARGLGKGSVRRITRDGQSKLVSIRTTQDRWIAFPRDERNKRWGTLDDVDMVVAASVDNMQEPRNARIHLFDAEAVRERYNRAYAARLAAGHTVPHGYGLWIGLYTKDEPDPVSHVGGGLGNEYPAIATIPLQRDLAPSDNSQDGEGPDDEDYDVAVATVPAAAAPDAEPAAAPLTIAEAKRRLALAFGVTPENVKITIEA